MRYILLLIAFGFAVTFTSCRDDFEFEPSAGGLQFSKDTVYLDTVFTNIGSSTYTLKVYNRSNKDIKIPNISLGQGDNSKYRISVDGNAVGNGSKPGKIFNDVELLAKDSMYIFVETTIDYSEYANNNTTFLYTDDIQFTSTNGTQKVELVTLVQDAVFIKPNRPLPTDAKETLTINGLTSDIQGHELSTPDELHWTDEKPYVVYGYALVPNGKSLEIDKGARVHFHADSGLIVDASAELHINGAASADPKVLENEVIFEGDRLEPDFSDVTGQWAAVIIYSNKDNTISHLTLRNATVGLILQPVALATRPVGSPVVSPKLTIDNSQVYNCANFNILSYGAVLNGSNLVAGSAGQASLAITFGGTYNFKQCTFANYFNSYNQVPVLAYDYLETVDENNSGLVLVSNLTANFDNCIMYGSGNLGLSLDRKGSDADGLTYKTTFNHCFIKMVDYGNQLKDLPLYPFDGNDPAQAFYDDKTREILAKNTSTYKPDFIDTSKNDFNIGTASAAIANGDATVAAQVPTDLNGVSRTASPDIGAYQHIAE